MAKYENVHPPALMERMMVNDSACLAGEEVEFFPECLTEETL